MLGIIATPLLISWIIQRSHGKTYSFSASKVMISLLCGITYVVARTLPEPRITNESITLAQHFVGGGFVSTLYFVYFIREFQLKLPKVAYFVLLYPFVSMMGVTNELLEFASTKLGIYTVDGTDTWWDLLANTLGAYSLFILILLFLKVFKSKLTVDTKHIGMNK
jgi:hypothetical protein